MSFKRKSMFVLLLLSTLLAACGGTTAEGESTLDVNAILTAGVGTLAASIFQTQTALVPQGTETSSPTANPTASPLTLPTLGPSATQGFVFVPVVGTSSLLPTATGTLRTPTPNPSTLAFGCNNLLLIRDETIPAGIVLRPQESFTKIWKVENNGTCNWALQYRLALFGGERMDAFPSGLGRVIEPARWTQLSLVLTAPRQPGTYIGYWRLGNQAGNMFGSTLTVSIVVGTPTNTPQPTETFSPVPPTVTPSETLPPTATETPTNTPIITPTTP